MGLRYSCHLPRALPLRPAARGAQCAVRSQPQPQRRSSGAGRPRANKPQKPPVRCRCQCTRTVRSRNATRIGRCTACPDRLLGSCFWCLDDAGWVPGCLARSYSPASRQLPAAAGLFVLGLGDVVGDWIATTACIATATAQFIIAFNRRLGTRPARF